MSAIDQLVHYDRSIMYVYLWTSSFGLFPPQLDRVQSRGWHETCNFQKKTFGTSAWLGRSGVRSFCVESFLYNSVYYTIRSTTSECDGFPCAWPRPGYIWNKSHVRLYLHMIWKCHIIIGISFVCFTYILFFFSWIFTGAIWPSPHMLRTFVSYL